MAPPPAVSSLTTTPPFNALVWAKIEGYRWWPAVVLDPGRHEKADRATRAALVAAGDGDTASSTCLVSFLATSDHARLPLCKLLPLREEDWEEMSKGGRRGGGFDKAVSEASEWLRRRREGKESAAALPPGGSGAAALSVGKKARPKAQPRLPARAKPSDRAQQSSDSREEGVGIRGGEGDAAAAPSSKRPKLEAQAGDEALKGPAQRALAPASSDPQPPRRRRDALGAAPGGEDARGEPTTRPRGTGGAPALRPGPPQSAAAAAAAAAEQERDTCGREEAEAQRRLLCARAELRRCEQEALQRQRHAQAALLKAQAARALAAEEEVRDEQRHRQQQEEQVRLQQGEAQALPIAFPPGFPEPDPSPPEQQAEQQQLQSRHGGAVEEAVAAAVEAEPPPGVGAVGSHVGEECLAAQLAAAHHNSCLPLKKRWQNAG